MMAQLHKVTLLIASTFPRLRLWRKTTANSFIASYKVLLIKQNRNILVMFSLLQIGLLVFS